jgi:dihydrofolate reductase
MRVSRAKKEEVPPGMAPAKHLHIALQKRREIRTTPRLKCRIMRNVVLGLGISLDGYIARLNGDVDFLFMPKDYSMAPFFATIDTAIMGRKTLDVGLKMSGGSLPDYQLATYVFSHSQPPGKHEGWTYINESPAAFVAKLRERPGKDIWLMGGGELARDFLKADLVDELYLGVVPVLLGEGIPLFPSGFPQRNFSLLENKTFSRSLIALKYKRVGSGDGDNGKDESASELKPKPESKLKRKS